MVSPSSCALTCFTLPSILNWQTNLVETMNCGMLSTLTWMRLLTPLGTNTKENTMKALHFDYIHLERDSFREIRISRLASRDPLLDTHLQLCLRLLHWCGDKILVLIEYLVQPKTRLSLEYHYGSFRQYRVCIDGHQHTSRTEMGWKHIGCNSNKSCNHRKWSSWPRSRAQVSFSRTVLQWNDLKKGADQNYLKFH